MAGITSPLANQMLIAAQSYALFISLHNGDPGNDGSNELDIDPYDREPAGWDAPSSGKLTLSEAVDLAVNANSSIGYYGLWTQKSQGTFLGGSSLSAVEVFTGAGTYTVASLNFSLAII